MSSENLAKNSGKRELFKHYESIRIDSESIIFSPLSHNIHFLNNVSTLIWELYINKHLSIKETSNELTYEFDIPFDVAFQDVNTIVKYWDSILSDKPYSKKTESNSLPGDLNLTYKYQTYIELPSISVEINSNDSQSINKTREIFSHLLINKNIGSLDYQIYISKKGGKYLIHSSQDVLEIAQSSTQIPVMIHRAITELACHHNNWITILHAGGVSHDNKAIIFPSAGGSGKSTLSAALIQSGFNYINDDVLPLLEDLSITPIPVSLCIKSGSWSVLEKWYPEINDLDIFGRNNLQVKYLQPRSQTIQSENLQAKYLITPKYNPHTQKVILEEISTVDALQGVIEAESLIKKPFTKNNLKRLVSCIDGLKCYSLEYSNLDLAIEKIKNLVNKK